MYPKLGKKIKKRKALKRIGSETRRWMEARKVLKDAYRTAGITSCELDIIHDCNSWQFLTWAHGDKRRNLTKEELYSLVILCCVNGHQKIEKMPREDMRFIIERVIVNRSVDPVKIIYSLGVIDDSGFFIWNK
jgi:hypothetical protein